MFKWLTNILNVKAVPKKTLDELKEEYNQKIKDEKNEFDRVKNLAFPEYTLGWAPGVGYRDWASNCPFCKSRLDVKYRNIHKHKLIFCKKCGYEYVKLM